MNYRPITVQRLYRRLHMESLEARTVCAAMPAFSLFDTNVASDTHGQAISPQQLQGEVTAWYFAHANCGYCTAQYGHLDTLQQELETAFPLLRISILGVNEAGFESANAQITAGRTIPWLQDVDADQDGLSDVWTESWQVTFRDVVILDGDGDKLGVYNLTDHNLGAPTNYAELKALLVDAALASQLPWHNETAPFDVNRDNVVAPLDALLVLIELNAGRGGKLAAPSVTQLPSLYDTNADGYLTPLDALLVINRLNAATQPQGESPSTDSVSEAAAEESGNLLDWLAIDQLSRSDRKPR